MANYNFGEILNNSGKKTNVQVIYDKFGYGGVKFINDEVTANVVLSFSTADKTLKFRFTHSSGKVRNEFYIYLITDAGNHLVANQNDFNTNYVDYRLSNENREQSILMTFKEMVDFIEAVYF